MTAGKRLEGDATRVIIGLSVLLNKDYGLHKSHLRDMPANKSLGAYLASI